MIKECFQDDENKCKELLTVISESIFQRNLEGLSYKERTEIEIADLKQKLAKIEQLRDQQLEQKGKQLEQIDKQLEQIENENNELRKEIEQLKKQLSQR